MTSRARGFGGADDDAVRPLEVVDRGALAQEFRIGDDGEIGVRPFLADDRLDLVAGADRDGRLGDDDGEALERFRDQPGGGMMDMGVAQTRNRLRPAAEVGRQ